MALTDKLTAIANGFRESNGTAEKLTLDEMAVLASQGSKLIEDVPTASGQWACLARASQMRDIVYQVKAPMVTAQDTVLMQPGTDYTGLIYSSVRATEWGFIGFPVSFYSYLTALNNPRSIAYTKKYTDYFSGGGENVSNVFGTNCSSYVSYCLGLPYLGVTNTLPALPGVEELCYTGGMVDTARLRTELKLCDFPIGDGHAVIITGIRRNSSGAIKEVDVSDSWPPRIRKKTYTWDDFVDYFINRKGYHVYRYNALESITFPENLHDIVYGDICTSRGDKVCIRPDQDISLNVLNAGDYVGIALFKDGELIDAQASTDDWELAGLTTGKYTAILYKSGESVTIDDATATNSTTFIICAVTVSRDGNVFTYTAEAVKGVYPIPMQIALKGSLGHTQQVNLIENDSFAGRGSVEVVPVSTPSIVNVPFQTEYGFVIAECSY